MLGAPKGPSDQGCWYVLGGRSSQSVRCLITEAVLSTSLGESGFGTRALICRTEEREHHAFAPVLERNCCDRQVCAHHSHCLNASTLKFLGGWFQWQTTSLDFVLANPLGQEVMALFLLGTLSNWTQVVCKEMEQWSDLVNKIGHSGLKLGIHEEYLVLWGGSKRNLERFQETSSRKCRNFQSQVGLANCVQFLEWV